MFTKTTWISLPIVTVWQWWVVSFKPKKPIALTTDLLPRYVNCGLRMPRECRERLTYQRFQTWRKPLVSDPDMHHGTCVRHVSWCMSGSLTRGGGENVPGIPGACITLNFTYLARVPWRRVLQNDNLIIHTNIYRDPKTYRNNQNLLRFG